jgi:hypothetical protein
MLPEIKRATPAANRRSPETATSLNKRRGSFRAQSAKPQLTAGCDAVTAARQVAPSIAFLRDSFELRAQSRAILVEACLMDFHEAIDGLQADAVRDGLVDRIGQDEVQKILAAAFANVPRPGELEDAIAATADLLENYLLEVASKPPPRTARSTIEAIIYTVRERGLAALKEPVNRERLLRCDRTARDEINQRIASMLKKGIIRHAAD